MDDESLKSNKPEDWIKGDAEAEMREVCARAGLALWTAQTMEHGIVNLLVAVQQIERLRNRVATKKSIREQLAKLWEDKFRLTLGQIVNSVRSAVAIDDDLKDSLERSIAARNRLAHGFFREHAVELLSWEGRRSTARELNEMRELFLSTDRKLQPIYDQVWVRIGTVAEGISQHVIDLAIAGASTAEIKREIEKELAAAKSAKGDVRNG
jgi:hypothetical protein